MLTLADASDSVNVTCELQLSPDLALLPLPSLEEWWERTLGFPRLVKWLDGSRDELW